ncbi:anhydro-N-acetylmuramic acid kinase [Shivajiella indica]|uniref:Anhydro-N-acetylmuramic acid kinase n=1 Tax=Shivajiella indica TaxID=872115 RepID=A0ABW5BCQ1_9BACT
MDNPNTYKMIGLMSGTSGDGLDIAYCEFVFDGKWHYSIPTFETVGFPEKLAKKLRKSHKLSGYKLSLLDVAFGKWMGEQVRSFVQKNKIQVNAVASHGHTVFHQPEKGISLQIGNGWALHRYSGIPVINDFRMLDVQLGGQGAPLVPIGDRLLFSEYDYCINLGGIANISMESAGLRIAFDICPFNLLLNYFSEYRGLAFDKNGELARSGRLLPGVFKSLNKISYYDIEGAKSLGREDLIDFMEILEGEDEYKVENILHTLVMHFVEQIKRSMKPIPSKKASVLVTGGGAFNTFFMEKLEEALNQEFEIIPANPTIINYKEALIFAFLGVLKLRKENNCLSSVTGASKDNCGGTVFGMEN